MEKDGELSSDSDDGAPLCVLSSSGGNGRAMPPEIAVDAEWAEDVLSRADEQAPDVLVSFLGDPHLWLAVTGIVT